MRGCTGKTRECRKHFRDRVQAHKSLVLSHGNTQQRRLSLREMRMAPLGPCNEHFRIEENIHLGKDVVPVCPRFRAALMNPQAVDLNHRRPLLDSLEKQALRLLNSIELRIRFETQRESAQRWAATTTLKNPC